MDAQTVLDFLIKKQIMNWITPRPKLVCRNFHVPEWFKSNSIEVQNVPVNVMHHRPQEHQNYQWNKEKLLQEVAPVSDPWWDSELFQGQMPEAAPLFRLQVKFKPTSSKHGSDTTPICLMNSGHIRAVQRWPGHWLHATNLAQEP